MRPISDWQGVDGIGKLGRENIYMLKSQPFFLEKKYHCEERELAFNPPCGVQTVAGILFSPLRRVSASEVIKWQNA